MKRKGRLVGLHIYPYNGDNYAFYNIFDKKAYLINGDDDYKKYVIYNSRLSLSIVIGFIVILFLKMYTLGVILGLAVYIGMSVAFYVKFIPSLPVIKKFSKPEGNFISRFIEPLSNARLYAISIMSIALGVLLIVNLYLTNYEQMIVIITYIIAALAILFGIVIAIAGIMRKNKQH